MLSAPAVDPSTLAPKGTILAAEKAQDSRATVRVPFTQVIPTLLKVRRRPWSAVCGVALGGGGFA